MKHLLLGYDGSPSSRRAFTFAMNLARLSGARLRVVNVMETTSGGGDNCAAMMCDSGRARAKALLEELLEMHSDAKEMVDIEVTHGSPGEQLLAAVREHGIDHMVIGHSERGALARWLLGSLSNDILDRASVPVTVVR